ncbi:hypothetical protein B0T17DRAFT_613230 [Bombardia bombarda]|uniref:Ankyrin repeat protein n=1 Tax=Bombardia bombarda TaxID=252184 RepID=A0AA39XM08_9PEZI|nr:hypothetical protein B0T17DRAFT_613230 [Bombardia bombarda]
MATLEHLPPEMRHAIFDAGMLTQDDLIALTSTIYMECLCHDWGGREVVCKLLQDHGAHVDPDSNMAWTGQLKEALDRNNDGWLVKFCLEHNILQPIIEEDEKFLFAPKERKLEMVRALFQSSSDLAATIKKEPSSALATWIEKEWFDFLATRAKKDGQASLILACEHGSADAVRRILEAGVSPLLTPIVTWDPYGNDTITEPPGSLLSIVLTRPYPDVELVALLLEHDVNLLDICVGQSTEADANTAQTDFELAICDDKIDALGLLLRHLGSDPPQHADISILPAATGTGRPSSICSPRVWIPTDMPVTPTASTLGGRLSSSSSAAGATAHALDANGADAQGETAVDVLRSRLSPLEDRNENGDRDVRQLLISQAVACFFRIETRDDGKMGIIALPEDEARLAWKEISDIYT